MNPENLCISLAKADTEKKVVGILRRAGYWDDPSVWHYYGNNENNFATIGNQQSRPDAAIVEKIINSVDSVLVRECLRRGINPESEDAPMNSSDALQEFYKVCLGRLSNLSSRRRAKMARDILLVATGTKSKPSYAIIDKGEGQTPERMPDTFLSLGKSNKLRIPFVQGKFNMGGTGAFQFCGRHNLQLVISKRDPEIEKLEDNDTGEYWGFTMVRRVDPEKGMKNSTYKYLAPNGRILMFKSESLPLLPGEYPKACEEPLGWGSFVKLYEYQMMGLKSPVYFDLYYRLSLLIPNIAHPVTLSERRKGYSGHTFDTVLSGLGVRLEEDRRENLEPGYPNSSNIRVMGQDIDILIYAFRKGKMEKYSRKEGIVFNVSGQAQGFFGKSFFRRKAVGLSYLDDSLLVLADCTGLDGRTREDLFMNSRDRLRHGDLRSRIELELEELLRKHPGIRELRERRRREEIEGKIGDAKPLLETIENIIKKSPTLSKLFVKGVKLTNPFDLRGVVDQEAFEGKPNPTFFALREEYSKEKPKCCPINRRFRVQFETDASNDYFTRESSPGKFSLWAGDDYVDGYSLNLWNGIGNLTADLPSETDVDDTLHFESEVDDIAHVDSFYNEFYVKVEKPQKAKEGRPGSKPKPAGEENGKDRDKPSHLSLPNIIEIRFRDWEEYGFVREDALSAKSAGEEAGYDFFVNMDNIHLQTEIKGRGNIDPRLLEAQYKYGMVLIGLALLNELESNEKQLEDEEEDVFSRVSIVARSISPFLLPMISSLSELQEPELR